MLKRRQDNFLEERKINGLDPEKHDYVHADYNIGTEWNFRPRLQMSVSDHKPGYANDSRYPKS
jgi:hypothetical protein